jgi:predicted RND superfamily exporter protein
MRRWIEIVEAHPLLITAVSILLTVVTTWIVATQWNIDSDFKALLPQESDAAKAMTDVGERVGSGSALFVVVDSPDPDANLKFVEKYAEELRAIDEVALAHYHNDKTFFEKRQLLYMEAEDLQTLHDRTEKAIKEAKKKANPLFVSLKDDEPVEVETDDIEAKYSERLTQNKYKEYFVSDDGYSMTIVVRFVETSTNLLATNELLDRVREVGQQLDPTSYHPEMTVELGGGLVNRKREYDSILGDIQVSAIFTVVALFGVIAVYFRRLRAVLLVLVPLAMSVVWTLAVALLVFDALTTITAFIFAILLGLGIDFSIHLLSSYDHERGGGASRVDALVNCYGSTGRATIIGAITTFSVFVVLAFAQFRGLSQFGVVAAVGVACAVAAMLATLPAMIVTFDRWAPTEPKRREIPFRFAPSRGTSIAWLVLAVGITALAGWSATNIIFEENFREIAQIDWPWIPEEDVDEARAHADHQGWRMAVIRFRHAREIRRQLEPETFVMDREQKTIGKKYSTAVGKLQTSTPTIVLFDDPANAAKTYRALNEAMETGAVDTIKGVASIWGFVPPAEEQKRRLKIIGEIRELLDGENLSGVSEKQRERIEELKPKLDVEAFGAKDLPLWSKRLFKEAGPKAKPPAAGEPFAYEYTVYLNEAIDSMVGGDARRFLQDVKKIGKETGLDLRVASPSVVYVAMLDQIKADGLRMIAIALVVVFLILTFAFRGPHRALIALTPLLIGVVWMLGAAAFLGIKLDFFNVIVLPVVLGIGIDDGVHFYHHFRESGSVSETMSRVGMSVTMTSITSMIGFGGLAVTDYAGLKTIGHLAICGIATTWLATLFVLPPLLALLQRRSAASAAE